MLESKQGVERKELEQAEALAKKTKAKKTRAGTGKRGTPGWEQVMVKAREQARLQQLYEQVILEVNIATRAINTAHDQIGPGLASADARQREVESIVARAERKDMNTLTTELNSRRSLAAARRTALNAIVEYNIAIIDLEKAKGTLLSYNNIVIDAVSP